MNIYVYEEDKTLLRKFTLEDTDDEMLDSIKTMLSSPDALREFVAEELFNHGFRRESARVSFVLTSINP